ncbi:MAG TPA: ANTAR domain-containing protein [Bacillota bacterium]|nr:ANTAR domain-containing protein [Bacillota bacterium]
MFGTRIVIADADAGYRKDLKDKLLHAGYLVTAEAGDGRSALKAIFQTEPDLVIMGASLRGAQIPEIARIIEEHRVAPVILLTSSYEQQLLEEVKSTWIFAYLVKPVSEAQLFSAIEIALANFRKLTGLEEEVKRLKKSLEERKIIEKAKGLLMEEKGFAEKDAYKHLQRLSMDNCVPIVHVAREIIRGFYKKG